jgi:hypothetical protein
VTKELTPLRKKDIETGRKLEREAIAKWLREGEFKFLAIAISVGEHLK